MKEIRHKFLKINKPNYIVVSDYNCFINNWHFYEPPLKDIYDIGVWHIKYK